MGEKKRTQEGLLSFDLSNQKGLGHPRDGEERGQLVGGRSGIQLETCHGPVLTAGCGNLIGGSPCQAAPISNVEPSIFFFFFFGKGRWVEAISYTVIHENSFFRKIIFNHLDEAQNNKLPSPDL